MSEPNMKMADVAVQREASVVEGLTHQLSNKIDMLDVAVSNLIHKIEPALGPNRKPVDPGTDSESVPEASELSIFLIRTIDQIGRIEGVVRIVTDRVEL